MMDIVEVEHQVELAHILERRVEGLHKDLQEMISRDSKEGI